MKNKYIILCFVLFILNCTADNSSIKIIMDNSEEGMKLRVKKDSANWEKQKERFPSSTHDLLPINEDTLIAATRFYGLISTTNAGRNWTKIATPGTIIKLTIDNNRQLWGLHSWQGIHEPDLCVLYLSKNLGQSWIKYELNTKEIFPADFYSQLNQSLRIIDYNNKIFKLKDISYKLNWALCDSVPKSDKVPNSFISKDFIIDSRGRKWTCNEEGIFLIGQDTTKLY